jgi:Protein of unknown function (DUF2946)
MRKRLNQFLPIVLIALMVQILAPIAASWAAALVAADVLGATEICHSLSAPEPVQTDQNADHSARDGACLICCVVQTGASLHPPQAVVAAPPYRIETRVVWLEATSNIAASRSGSNSQARAPPQVI